MEPSSLSDPKGTNMQQLPWLKNKPIFTETVYFFLNIIVECSTNAVFSPSAKKHHQRDQFLSAASN